MSTADKPPRDWFLLSYVSLTLLGMATLVPFNAFTIAFDYFQMRHGAAINLYIASSYMYPQFLATLPLIFLLPRIHVSIRLMVIISAMGIIMALTVILVIIQLPLLLDFIVLLGLVMTCALIGSAFNTTVFGLAAAFPGFYSSAVMFGQGLAGIGVSLLRIATKISFPDTYDGTKWSAVLYFVIALVFFVIIFFVYIGFALLPYSRYWMKRLSSGAKKKDESAERGLQISREDYTQINSEPDDQEPPASKFADFLGKALEKLKSNKVAIVFVKNWRSEFNVGACFFVTLALYPGILCEIPSYSMRADWYPVLLLTEFNALDTVGRNLPGYIRLFSPKSAWVPVALRFFFFITFGAALSSIRLISSDLVVYLFLALFSISNGYLTSLSMVYGATNEDLEESEQEVAGMVMIFCLNAGLLLGSLFAFVINFVVSNDTFLSFLALLRA